MDKRELLYLVEFKQAILDTATRPYSLNLPNHFHKLGHVQFITPHLLFLLWTQWLPCLATKLNCTVLYLIYLILCSRPGFRVIAKITHYA